MSPKAIVMIIEAAILVIWSLVCFMSDYSRFTWGVGILLASLPMIVVDHVVSKR